MKNEFNTIGQPELSEAEINSIEHSPYKGKLAIKDKTILQNNLPETPRAGYGSCRACNCRGYISKHDGSHECKTCNHHYDRHN